jgi:hypothetical protein
VHERGALQLAAEIDLNGVPICSMKAVVVRARMEERPGAEEALHDLELNGWQGRFAEAVVSRLPHQMAAEMHART